MSKSLIYDTSGSFIFDTIIIQRHSIFYNLIVDHMIKRKSSLNEVPPERIIIGVAGGSAAGKTTLCETIYRQMAFDQNFKVEIISLDSFYKSKNYLI